MGSFFTRTSCGFAMLVWSLGLLCVQATPSQDGKQTASPAEVQEELLSIQETIDWERPDSVEERLHTLLALTVRGSEEERTVLLTLTDHYKKHKRLVSAIATLQEATNRFKDDPDRPRWFFELGLLYRELGTVETAVARFYQVLNPSTIRGEDEAAYRELSQQAQFEIARTYFQQGRHSLARELFERIQRLDIADADQETVLYYLIRCQFSEGLLEEVATSAEQFSALYPQSVRRTEIRFMQAQAMEWTGRSDEALEVVMELLREEHPQGTHDPERWRQWQQKAGNFFANHYYTLGDASTALTIYQALAELSDEPRWLWPVVYQIGICAERLGANERARDAYLWLRTQATEQQADKATLPLSLQLVLEGAAWREQHLNRVFKVESKTRALNEGSKKNL